MSIQVIQLVMISIYLILAVVVLRAESSKIKVGAAIIIAILVFANPVRFKQESASVEDRKVNRFDDIPEKVEVYEMDYQEFQNKELNNLKTQSGELKNEVHN